ncbi:MAG: F0F1 ATP synthase subunit C [Pseudomonadota bacterium]|nr:F0F1 ATP synthase subunit C [Pseudomonadota bacterium]
MEIESARVFAAAIAVLPLLGVGYALGNIFSTLISSIARNPATRDTVFPIGILAFALTEAIALFALLIAFLILFL